MRLKCTNPNCDSTKGRVVASTYVLLKFNDDGNEPMVQVLDSNTDGIAEDIIKYGTSPETTPIRCVKCGAPMIFIQDEEDYTDRLSEEQRATELLGATGIVGGGY